MGGPGSTRSAHWCGGASARLKRSRDHSTKHGLMWRGKMIAAMICAASLYMSGRPQGCGRSASGRLLVSKDFIAKLCSCGTSGVGTAQLSQLLQPLAEMYRTHFQAHWGALSGREQVPGGYFASSHQGQYLKLVRERIHWRDIHTAGCAGAYLLRWRHRCPAVGCSRENIAIVPVGRAGFPASSTDPVRRPGLLARIRRLSRRYFHLVICSSRKIAQFWR